MLSLAVKFLAGGAAIEQVAALATGALIDSSVINTGLLIVLAMYTQRQDKQLRNIESKTGDVHEMTTGAGTGMKKHVFKTGDKTWILIEKEPT